MTCDQEMCPHWAGDGGCPCALLDIPRANPPISPDCRDGKHAACIGDAWDDVVDEPTDCTCECHDGSAAA